MPAEDVSDLRDVVDAINRLCETMKTSTYDEVCEDVAEANWQEEEAVAVEGDDPELISPEEVAIDKVETHVAEEWSDASPPHATVVSGSEHATVVSGSKHTTVVSDTEHATIVSDTEHATIVSDTEHATIVSDTEHATIVSDTEHTTVMSEYEHASVVSDYEHTNIGWENEHTAVYFEPQSEMYYTASEVSLLSDEAPEKMQDEERVRDDRQSVIAGHVAAMRERFESMTRANTPCPDLARSLSPSLDVFRNITPSPDRLD